jgi:hypothetical protein
MNLRGEPARDDLRLSNVFRRADEMLKQPGVREHLKAALAQVIEKTAGPRPRRYSILAYIKSDWSFADLVPGLLKPFVEIGPNFCIRQLLPLVPMLDQSFDVLALTESSYRFFECNASFIHEKLTGAAPTRDEPLRMQLQSHSVGTVAPGAHPGMVFHVGGYQEKDQTARFFAEVDRSVNKERGQNEAPLVLMAVERMVSLYREITQCTHVVREAIAKDPSYLIPSEVHDLALPVVRRYAASRDQAFLKSSDADLAASLSDTIQFASKGRVHTLFVANEAEVWGLFDIARGNIVIHPERRIESEDLLNIAALQTISHGGTAIGVSQHEMPKGKITVAKYRY